MVASISAFNSIVSAYFASSYSAYASILQTVKLPWKGTGVLALSLAPPWCTAQASLGSPCRNTVLRQHQVAIINSQNTRKPSPNYA
jgi:hypothetical protein